MLCAGGGFSFGATPEDEADALQKVSFFPTTSEHSEVAVVLVHGIPQNV